MSWLSKTISSPTSIVGTAISPFSGLGIGASLLGKGVQALTAPPSTPNYGAPGAMPPDLAGYHSPSFNYARIDSALNNPLFQQGRDLLGKDQGMNSPENQAALSNIDAQGKLLYDKLTSGASALAGRRGLAGSSIEQYGVAQAGQNAGQATLDARNAILLQASQQAAQGRQLAASSLFNQGDAGIAGEYGLTNTGAQLSSDELTSLRNMYLGNQATQLGYANVNQADKANQRSNNPVNLLLGGIGSGATAAIARF